MDIHGYFRAIRKYWWLVLVMTLLGVGAGVGATIVATPMYQSTVTFFVSTPTEGTGSTALQADQYAQRRVNSYVGLLTSERLANMILNSAQIDMTSSQVARSIAGSAELNTVLLTATVTDSSAPRSLVIATALAEQFGKLVQELENENGGGVRDVQLEVVSGPTLNPNPVSPRPVLNVGVGLLVGLALGLTAAILRYALDTTFRTPQTLVEVTRLPVLGVLPRDKESKKSPLIVEGQARSVKAEAFRQLRTNLQFIDATNPVRVLVVTSALAGDGKSTTATNLAISFSSSGQRVLLIEADLRRPRIADFLGLEREVGLTNVLVGQAAVQDVIQTWGNLGLSVLPSGTIPPNPAELLGSPAMSNLLAHLRRQFGLIIIDTPPLLPVTDAAIAARVADGAILVVRYGKTSRNQVVAAVRSLRAVDARILGSILSRVPQRGADGYTSYGYDPDQHHLPDVEDWPPTPLDDGEGASEFGLKRATRRRQGMTLPPLPPSVRRSEDLLGRGRPDQDKP